MRDLPAQAHFIVQALEKNRIARETRGEKLQRDLLPEFDVVGA